ncbi:protein-L-isoaspartate O-methyltransferase [Allocatelliglobosispora scoriae]|uniref:Protein-L-isoaspartate O-methyltransferase n=1 Tax=Allocatelliglobosispora scoriae TaxID=643052 RepID=A0A841BI17_9ACTN|nr:methyltransferase domain-containing protein [Allocatelliglobosispora scoriae]MBB5866819.1 protein-L-isoaspartate O-methyltransferase [Allocatelliglobosispora scoriae]
MSDLINAAITAVPRDHYTDSPPPSSMSPSVAVQSTFEHELLRAELRRGMRVLEVGTGTGYTGALLAEIVGPSGHVVSIDADSGRTERAGRRTRHGMY